MFVIKLCYFKMNSTMSFVTLDAIGIIKREIGYSYPYSAGSVIINCDGFDRKTLQEIITYFLNCKCSININYEKNQVKISGYMNGY